MAKEDIITDEKNIIKKNLQKKGAMWGNHLQSFGYLLQLVKLIKYKKELSEVTLCKITVVSFSCTTFVGFPKKAKSS